jgi:hypothetical protein
MKSIDFIDKASYSGNVVLENFDLGTFRSEKSGENFNEHRCRGQRFTEKFLNTALKGMSLK